MKYLLAQTKIIIISFSLTNGIFNLFLVIFGTYANYFCCVVLLNSWQRFVPLSYGKPLSLKIYFVHFLSSEGPCDKQNLTFVVI